MPPKTSKKFTANPIRPARHRPGKPSATETAASISSSEEESEEEEDRKKQQITRPKPLPLPPKASSFPAAALTARKKQDAERRAAFEAEFETESEEEGGSESGSESGESGSEGVSLEEESSSEDEAPRKLLRPVFLRKDQRKPTDAPSKSQEEKEAEEQIRKEVATKTLIQEQIERAAAEKLAAKKNWDDEDNVADIDEISDTDNKDPEAEYAGWKLRELTRIKRARIAIEEAEKEHAEVERRRNLSKEEREAEDREYLEKQKEEKGDRGNMQFMQKYFHKGAFFQEDLKDIGVDRRNIMSARFEDSTNREVLPEFMQIRDMTKLGKKGRTRYRDMKTEDTGRWGDYADDRRKKRDDYGLDERFRSDGHRNSERDNRDGPSGANAKPLGERKRYGEERDREGKRPRVDDR